MEASLFGSKKDSLFMQKALQQARIALLSDEVPVGAVVVDQNGLIIGEGYNTVENNATQTGHAEVVAIEQATEKKGDWRLHGCWLYVTLEPCLMCFGLIMLSRFSGVVYGTDSPLYGFRLDTNPLCSVYKKGAPIFVSGVQKDESALLLKRYFREKRNPSVKKQSIIDRIKKGLIDRKLELEDKLSELSKERFSDDQVQDPGDQALSSTMESLRTSLQDTELQEYQRIIRALEKIDDGSYGVCIDCGNAISERRLESYPDAARCIVCQETFEDSR